MNDVVVTTFPIKPLNKVRVGSFTAPVYVDLIAKKIECKSVLSLNVLNSYKNLKDDCSEYINILKEVGLRYDEVYTDFDNLSKLLECIKLLDNKGLLIEKQEEILCCDCGKVDIVSSTLTSHINSDLLEQKEDQYYCKACKSKCNTVNQKRLFLKINDEYVKPVLAIPNIYDDNIHTIYDMLKESVFLISKERDTGVKYKGYNIDIDFVWNNYIGCFEEKKVVIVTGNKHLVKVFLTNYLANVFNKEIIYVLHPFIEKKSDINWKDTLYKYDDYYKKLFLIYSAKWNNRVCYYDPGLFKSLAKLKSGGRENLYNLLIDNKKSDNLYKCLNNFILTEINFQKNLETLKRKKMLISDYDNTLHIHFEELLKNGFNFEKAEDFYNKNKIINSIEKFKHGNNIFCINTGRSFRSFKSIDFTNCYDYLVCNNGSELYDSNDKLLYYNSIYNKDVEIITNYSYKNNCMVKIHLPEGITDNKKMTAVSIYCEDECEFKNLINYFNCNLSHTKCYYKFPKIRLVNNMVDKTTPIQLLIDKKYIGANMIYAIGDSDNDIALLSKFKSATMKWCSKEIKKLNLKEYEIISDYIEEIINEKSL